MDAGKIVAQVAFGEQRGHATDAMAFDLKGQTNFSTTRPRYSGTLGQFRKPDSIPIVDLLAFSLARLNARGKTAPHVQLSGGKQVLRLA